MLLERPAPVEQSPLKLTDVPPPAPGADEILVRVRACGVCHTDRHAVEGEITGRLPIIPGHQIVGVDERSGARVGIPWLHQTCGTCEFCRSDRENLCDAARFSGLHVHGGYAEYAVAPRAFAVNIPEVFDDVHAAPLLCAGIVGFRALRLALAGSAEPVLSREASWPGSRTADAMDSADSPPAPRVPPAGLRLGLYGFGGSAHLVIQIAVRWQCEVFVATRGADHQRLARELGAAWVGRAEEVPAGLLDAAIMFAPAGALVPEALRALRKGGTLALGGIYLSPIPELPYAALYHERVVRSVANATRDDARRFLQMAGEIPLKTEVETFPLEKANAALAALKASRLRAPAVLVV